VTPARHNRFILSDATLDSHFAEAYRALRADITLGAIDWPVRSILVTSATSRESKTTTVINLGVVMAQAGSRVIIVDANFRQPALHHFVGSITNGVKPTPGLSNLIVGTASVDEVLTPTGFERVKLVPAGVAPPNPSELLSSQRMKAASTQLSERADMLIFDSPPCALYSDAFVLARLADGVLFVFRAGSHDRETQLRVHRRLRRAKARMLGIVFNGASAEATSRGAFKTSDRSGRRKLRGGKLA